jgi:hypothetical protein
MLYISRKAEITYALEYLHVWDVANAILLLIEVVVTLYFVQLLYTSFGLRMLLPTSIFLLNFF